MQNKPNIDATTVASVRDTITQGIEQGLSLDDITAQLTSVFGDENRARLIAQTEGLRAYNNGAFARWQAAGVTQAKWATVNDGHICPACRRLNGTIGDIATGWTDPDTGAVYRDSAHPGCRCFRVPIL